VVEAQRRGHVRLPGVGHGRRGRRHEGAGGERAADALGDGREPVALGAFEPRRQTSRGLDLVGAIAGTERRPQLGPGRAELRDQLARHLAQGLRLTRERRQEVAVVDAATAEGLARVAHDLVAEREGDRVGADEQVDRLAAPVAGHRVGRTADLVRGLEAELDDAHEPAVEGRAQGAQRGALARPRLGAGRVARVLRVEPGL
jgi:hypothetical protein